LKWNDLWTGDVDHTTFYEFNDKQASLWSETIFYRLKQVDFDGSFTYSSVRLIEFSETLVQSLIYPNPILNGETVVVQADEIKKVEIYSSHGELIYQINENVPVRSTSIPSPGFSKGIYIVIINEVDKYKLIVN